MYRGPAMPPAPFGMPHSQGKWGMLLRPKREIPRIPRSRILSIVGADEAEADEVGAELPNPSNHEDSSFLTREEYQDCCSRQGWWTQRRGWPS